MEEWDNLISSKKYQTLVDITNNAISADPQNTEALIYKGRGLVYLRLYKQAFNVFIEALNLPLSFKRKKKIEDVMRRCVKIILFEENYENNCLEAEEYSKDWYSRRLDKIAKKNQVRMPFKVFENEEKDSIFILGPMSEVNGFMGHEANNSVYKRLITPLHNFPCAQVTKDGWIYHKDQIYKIFNKISTRQYERYDIYPIYKFPTVNWEIQNNSSLQIPHPDCDVYVSYDLIDKNTSKVIQWSLDRLANATNDYFVPMYQNIIDPNLTVSQKDSKYSWMASEFIVNELPVYRNEVIYALQLSVSKTIRKKIPKYIVMEILSYLIKKDDRNLLSVGRAKLCSPISNLDVNEHKEFHVAVETVFNTALPLLSKLRRPALLLPGKVQAVIKAQKIYLQPEEEYTGVWHTDGKNEDIVAVILYYYRVSDNLVGGDLEFIDKRPRQDHFWLGGDCTPDTFTDQDAKDFLDEQPHCRISIKTGTLIVFSNYQFVHRVLRMVYSHNDSINSESSGGLASRDFLAFFIVDQRKPLISTRELHNIGQAPTEFERENRENLFIDQIKPSGKFGISSDLISSTGNGCVALLGWLWDNMGESDTSYGEADRSAIKRLPLFNLSPPLGRGISWALDSDNYLLENDESEEDEWS